MNVLSVLLKRAGACVRGERRSFAVLLVAMAAVSVLSAPVAMAATPAPQAAEAVEHASGEAILKLPDLGQAEFFGVNGRTLLMGGLVVCVLGLLFGLVVYRQLEGAAGPHVDARDLRAHLRDLQDLPAPAGQVPPDPRAVHRRSSSSSTSASCSTCEPAQRRDHPGLQPDRHRRQLRRGLVRHPDQHVRQLAHGLRQPRGQAVPRATRSRSRPA